MMCFIPSVWGFTSDVTQKYLNFFQEGAVKGTSLLYFLFRTQLKRQASGLGSFTATWENKNNRAITILSYFFQMCFLQNCFFLSYLWNCARQSGSLFTSSAKLRIWKKVNNSVGNMDRKCCIDCKKQRYAAVLYKSSLNGKNAVFPLEGMNLSCNCKVSQLCLTALLSSGNFSIKFFIAFFLNEKNWFLALGT